MKEEAAALLELATDPGLAGEIGLLRVLMRRLFMYTTDVGKMPLLEMARVGQLLIRGLRAVADLLKADQALRPTQKEIWQVVMDRALDDLSEEWGLEL